jgi:hypothetical protein
MEEAGNLYTTTISVLVSAVQKIARAMRLPEGLRLFRGMGGLMDLPKEFFVPDPQGVRGFVEWGFMRGHHDGGTGMKQIGKIIQAGDLRQPDHALDVHPAHPMRIQSARRIP